MENKAFNQGYCYFAKSSNPSKSDNPFHKGSLDYESWLLGYTTAYNDEYMCTFHLYEE